MRNFKFSRTTIPVDAQYGKLYEFIKDVFTVGSNYRKYESIDWEMFGSHTVLLRHDDMIRKMTLEEYNSFLRENTAMLSDLRIKEFMPIFHLLAKIQCSEDLLVEIRGGEIV